MVGFNILYYFCEQNLFTVDFLSSAIYSKMNRLNAGTHVADLHLLFTAQTKAGLKIILKS
ncbi:hypothetical protein AUJ95_08765 [Candidatus Desantisbacteria bacterium CG2_30_40_21]|uniref:Uncharacterized protein n=4 Tax=unclassified Candidatus Desantisiibacteriota TaxID=3106372 RepID=A0A2M7JDC5_9BACT|nr:MAG: hypothetical protein AUJ95_08765 [Candidatus Desantisbacteria bacterium CG2_30_40_21]PIP39944.1 MAG: hypothetical protein COX18_08530 [Candidatus Desantisbacteria bacterium CG23_combo_of_CG06-09_8_20_14_all_40_23]PIX17422.1 MAG: hypothetical protein COZ71_03430 [Candidatus Desantisbacteria bacterium CG_4_8_14_3_um_filter_40_12]PJB29124.1 MAG: hypothetical protein CO110_07610 [Candidatus Desantisbacteria bacterium CG_4_9_14_3_um_filter_40_11]